MKKIYFYLPSGTINEATKYYCDLLRSGMESAGYVVDLISSSKEIERNEAVLVIRPTDSTGLSNRNLFTWFQGIGPEEYKMLHNNLRGTLFKKYLEWKEKRTLKKSVVCFMVSEKMLNFYERKYRLKLRHKSIIIPCYNKHLDSSSFLDPIKYDNPSFVYAGAMYEWQCIDETLKIFKHIEGKIPNATLTLLTSQKDVAEKLIRKNKIKNALVDFEPLETLQTRLKEFKYGFLLRKNDVVNNVATPTKMNSYLAAGIIPIYTDVVEAFEKNIHLKEYELKFNLETQSYNAIAERIVEFDKHIVNKENFADIVGAVFNHFYNDSDNIELIRSTMTNLPLN